MPSSDPQLGEIWLQRTNGGIEAYAITSFVTTQLESESLRECQLTCLADGTRRWIQESVLIQNYLWCDFTPGSIWVDFAGGVIQQVRGPLEGLVLESHRFSCTSAPRLTLLDGEDWMHWDVGLFVSTHEPLALVVEGPLDAEARHSISAAIVHYIDQRRIAVTDLTNFALLILDGLANPPDRTGPPIHSVIFDGSAAQETESAFARVQAGVPYQGIAIDRSGVAFTEMADSQHPLTVWDHLLEDDPSS